MAWADSTKAVSPTRNTRPKNVYVFPNVVSWEPPAIGSSSLVTFLTAAVTRFE